jgi:hypothetical protein
LHLTDFGFCFENLHCYIFIHYDGNIHAVRVTSSPHMLTLFLCTWLHGFPYLPIGIMWISNWLLLATCFENHSQSHGATPLFLVKPAMTLKLMHLMLWSWPSQKLKFPLVITDFWHWHVSCCLQFQPWVLACILLDKWAQLFTLHILHTCWNSCADD